MATVFLKNLWGVYCRPAGFIMRRGAASPASPGSPGSRLAGMLIEKPKNLLEIFVHP